MKHHITKYQENNKRYAEAWFQINIFGKAFCFSRKRIEIGSETEENRPNWKFKCKWCGKEFLTKNLLLENRTYCDECKEKGLK